MKCIVIDDDKLIHIQLSKYAEKIKDCEMVGMYTTAEEALEDLEMADIDLIFLDIEMPGMGGLDFIKAFAFKKHIVIISANEKYAVDAFEYEIDDYLLKPIEFSRFVRAVNKVKSAILAEQGAAEPEDGMFVKENASTYKKILYKDIYWIEALENYVSINTTSNRYTIHITMKAMEKQLPAKYFLRIHRSYIVNLTKIDGIEDNYAILHYRGQRKSIPIAKSYKEELMNRLKILK